MTTITFVFATAIAIVFLLGAVGVRSRRQSLRRMSNAAPGLMTSLGVTGTFVGIVIGLLAFDVLAIDESVPGLLEGLRTAFITSVIGLAASIVFRMGRTVVSETEMDSDAAEDPVALLRKIAIASERQAEALGGDRSDSLSNQIKLLRSGQSDGFDAQIKAFEDFAEQMAENNSKALIEALEEVISEFNTKLNEQFGDNFKQLNQGVEKLVGWQQTYKDHVERMEERIATAVASLEQTQAAIEGIRASMQEMPQHAIAMKSVVDEAGRAIGVTGALLTGIEALSSRVGEAYPRIEQNIENLTQTLADSAKVQRDTLTETAENLSNEMRQGMETLQSGINDNFQTFDSQMQQELERTLQLFGDQLASISSKLAGDYNQFADAAEKVLNAARRSSEFA